MQRTTAFFAFLIVLMMSTSAALTAVPAMAQAQETVFTVGWGAAPMDTLNPAAITQYDGGAYLVMHALYDTLVRADPNGNPISDLAESWTFKDPTTVVFKLVQNAVWHDGQPFTADDVVFTMNLYQTHSEFPMMHVYVENMKSVTALDKYSVEVQLNNPDATFVPGRAPGMYILPKHLWETVANFTVFTNPNPVGTGPFKFVKWGGPDTYVEFIANPDYFLGRPHIDRLVFRYFTSYNAMALAIQSGEIDYAGPLFPPAIVPTLTSAIGIEVITRPDPRYYYFCFNAYEMGSGNPTLRDKTVRIALSHAINNAELATVVWSGYATPQNTVVPLVFGEWVNPNVKSYEFNLEEAARMLDDAGYKKGSDGIRVSPTGVRMSYKIEVPSNYAEEYRAAQVIADWWKQIGVEATAQITDVGTLGDEVVSWKHDTFIWAWSVGEILGSDYFLSMFRSSEAQPAPNSGWSDSGFSNPTYDALYEQQAQETDQAKRRDIIWQMQQILHEEAVYVPLYDPNAVQAFRSDRFIGLPQGTMPPLNQFSTNNLLLSVTPIVALTAPPAAGPSTELIAAIAVVIVAIIAIVVIATRRKTTTGKTQ